MATRIKSESTLKPLRGELSEGARTLQANVKEAARPAIERALLHTGERKIPTDLLDTDAKITNLNEIERELKNRDTLYSLSGCENSKASRMVMETLSEALLVPQMIAAHWQSQDTVLRGELAELHGVKPSQVFITSGAMMGINYAFDMFVKKGTRVGLLKPDFPGFFYFAEKYKSDMHSIKTDFPFAFKMDDIINFANSNNIEFLIFSSPSAVTGRSFSRGQIKKLLSTTNAIVVNDEADTLTTNSTASLTNQYDNLMIIRSFSKSYGLAGLRIGYIVVPEALSEYFNNSINPIEMTSLALLGAKVVLRDKDFLIETQQRVLKNLSNLRAALSDTDYKLSVGRGDCFASYLWAEEGIKDPYLTLLEHEIRILKGSTFGLEKGGRVSLANEEGINLLIKTLPSISRK